MKKIVGILSSLLASLTLFVLPVFADSVSVDFENPPYLLGNINGQDDWVFTGSYDTAVVANTFGFSTFGTQSFRISDALTSGSFGDWVFTKSLTNDAGETTALTGGFSGGTRQNHFEAEFDIATVLPTQQSGLHISISPDRGDGARMSYLRFEDLSDGVHVFFDDYFSGDFRETDIATIDRNPHMVKFVMDFADGPANDVVNIYIDGVLKITGTSWEDYFREWQPANAVPTVDSLIIQSRTGLGPITNPANLGNGFLIDNLSLSSSIVSPTPENKDQCKKDGWMSFNNPTFKNQGDCVSFVQSNEHAIGNKEK